MARTRANDYDKKRQGILSRSAALFAEHGYTGTSITMIAEACGVSKALMYHYYSSKDAVLFDLLQDHLQNLVTVVEAAAQSAGKPEEKLFAISAALLEAYRGATAGNPQRNGAQAGRHRLRCDRGRDSARRKEAAAIETADHVVVRDAELALSLVSRRQGYYA
jgi:AcrR family transcriptional regulator